MFRSIVLFSLLGVIAAHPLQTFEQHLSPDQAKRLEEWTEDDSENIWELSGQFEGDILLRRDPRTGILDETLRWWNNEIPYELDSDYTFEEREKIVTALTQYEATNVRVRPRTPSDVDYVYVNRNATGCSSFIGRVGNVQVLNLAPGCLRAGTIVHEFLHAFGFYHQQSATNRDDYVTIVWDNIAPDHAFNFDKYDSSVIGEFGGTYDYGSVMHYSEKAFSINGESTIIPHDSSAVIGQRVGLSEIDIKRLNQMYPKLQ
ncbi:hypothetical protein PPYR_06594 [Photinus pyralis]|uniref:Metalloendopeptidase n=3 Tax=Photinus pyralis TaxID=7054 RepID=A0A5N4AU03_PHOPY|nr:zinc metalloproteinase nas-14-like [Photinus pyralis]XP_031338482.1 zinc metalloproteinase nas-14-like [Photinus pyralis]KAB0800773.1 hypothetical protein PPYR_06512 [Photinus pyralis]KAB0800855.1 hypothetical protein PPYR_06594 [Photinus pyralis]